MRYLASILILAALAASPGCKASLGSTDADRERAADIGSTAGAASTAIPGAAAVGTILGPLTDLAAREGERRAASQGEGGLDIWTQILLGIGAFGGIFTGGKTLVRNIVAKAADAASTPPKA